MTPFRMVVSWLAFLFLAWRGSFLAAVRVLDFWGVKPCPEPENILLLLGMRGPTLNEVLPWSLLWFWPAAALIAPWGLLLPGRLWNSPVRRKLEDPLLLRLNAAGRWAFALFVVACLLRLLPQGAWDWLSWNPYAGEEPLRGWFLDHFRLVLIGVLAAMLIAPELAPLASSRLTGFIDSVFFPGNSEARPPYSLKLARHYVESRRWADAENEFARVLEWHPDQREAWEERLALAFRRDDRGEPAPEDVLALGLAALPEAADKMALHQRFTRNQPGVVCGLDPGFHPPGGERVAKIDKNRLRPGSACGTIHALPARGFILNPAREISFILLTFRHMAFAIIKTGGKQYRVSQGTRIEVEKLDVEVGSSIQLDQVLFVGTDSDLKIGDPILRGASVTAKVLDQFRAAKVTNFKFKRRKGYHRTIGHRRQMTRLEIEAINA